jgi:hypothetical protein
MQGAPMTFPSPVMTVMCLALPSHFIGASWEFRDETSFKVEIISY